jgi:hypothetical protein
MQGLVASVAADVGVVLHQQLRDGLAAILGRDLKDWLVVGVSRVCRHLGLQ